MVSDAKLMLVDSASFTEVLLYLKDAQHSWVEDTAIDFTTKLIFCEHVRFAPGVGAEGPLVGDYGHLVHLFGADLRRLKITDDERQLALNVTTAWLEDGDSRAIITRKVLSLVGNHNVQLWLNAHHNHVWLDMSERVGAVFNEPMIHPLSQILGASENEVAEVHRISARPQKLRELLENPSQVNDGLNLLNKAFLAAFLIRGKYHNDIAQRRNLQIYHHCVRAEMLEDRAPDQSPDDSDGLLAEVERAVGFMVLKSSKAENGERRLELYRDNVVRARRRLLDDDHFTFPNMKDFSKQDGERLLRKIMAMIEIKVLADAWEHAVEIVASKAMVVIRPFEHATGIDVVPKTLHLASKYRISQLAGEAAGRVHWPKSEELVFKSLE